MSRQSLQSMGDAAFARSDRVSAELLALTYGSFVRQLLLDYEDVADVNTQLDAVGYNIGVRLVDDFLAKSKISAFPPRAFIPSRPLAALLAVPCVSSMHFC